MYIEANVGNWEVGMTFKSHLESTDAITIHIFKEEKMISFALSDMKRVIVACKKPCKWHAYVSLNFDKSFQLKNVGPGKHL